jgi:hypothetical protein
VWPGRDHPRARAEGGNVSQKVRLDLLPVEFRARGDQHEAGFSPCSQPRLQQILALGREQPLALAMLALAQLADQFQFLVLAALDHRK